MIWFLNTNENKLSTQKNKSEKNPVKLSKYAIRKRPQTFAIVIKNEMEEKNRIKWKYIRILVSTRLKPAFTQFKREETSRWSQSIKNVGTLHAKSFFNCVFFPFFLNIGHWMTLACWRQFAPFFIHHFLNQNFTSYVIHLKHARWKNSRFTLLQ